MLARATPKQAARQEERGLCPSPTSGTRIATEVLPPLCRVLSCSQPGEPPSTPDLACHRQRGAPQPGASSSAQLEQTSHEPGERVYRELGRVPGEARAAHGQGVPAPPLRPHSCFTQALQGHGWLQGMGCSSYLVVLSCPFACGSLSFVIFITILFLTCMEEGKNETSPLGSTSSALLCHVQSPQLAQPLLRTAGTQGHGGFQSISQRANKDLQHRARLTPALYPRTAKPAPPVSAEITARRGRGQKGEEKALSSGCSI